LKDFKFRTLNNHFLSLLFLPSFLWCLILFSLFPLFCFRSFTKPTTYGNRQDYFRERGKSQWSYLLQIIQDNFNFYLNIWHVSFFLALNLFFLNPGVQMLDRHQRLHLSLLGKDPMSISAYETILTVCCDATPLWEPILMYTFKWFKTSAAHVQHTSGLRTQNVTWTLASLLGSYRTGSYKQPEFVIKI
jgi:hypothetical protein